jgi:hypothetical protein
MLAQSRTEVEGTVNPYMLANLTPNILQTSSGYVGTADIHGGWKNIRLSFMMIVDISVMMFQEIQPKVTRMLYTGYTEPIERRMWDRIAYNVSQGRQFNFPDDLTFIINSSTEYSVDEDMYGDKRVTYKGSYSFSNPTDINNVYSFTHGYDKDPIIFSTPSDILTQIAIDMETDNNAIIIGNSDATNTPKIINRRHSSPMDFITETLGAYGTSTLTASSYDVIDKRSAVSNAARDAHGSIGMYNDPLIKHFKLRNNYAAVFDFDTLGSLRGLTNSVGGVFKPIVNSLSVLGNPLDTDSSHDRTPEHVIAETLYELLAITMLPNGILECEFTIRKEDPNDNIDPYTQMYSRRNEYTVNIVIRSMIHKLSEYEAQKRVSAIEKDLEFIRLPYSFADFGPFESFGLISVIEWGEITTTILRGGIIQNIGVPVAIPGFADTLISNQITTNDGHVNLARSLQHNVLSKLDNMFEYNSYDIDDDSVDDREDTKGVIDERYQY